MGASIMIAKWLGSKLGGAMKVPVKDIDGIAIMFPYIYKYEDRIKDLSHEADKLSPTYLNELIDEAMKKHDFKGLKVIHDYLKHQSYNTDDLLQKVIQCGRSMRLDQWMNHRWGDPFAMIDTITRHLC